MYEAFLRLPQYNSKKIKKFKSVILSSTSSFTITTVNRRSPSNGIGETPVI